MTNWYVGSVDYTAVVQWAAGATLAVGAIRRQLAAPALNAERCFRVSSITTGVTGGSEPAWTLTNNGTTTDGGVTWTECTGQEGHQRDNGATVVWTAPAARISCLMSAGKNIVVNSDTVFLSSDHAETTANAINFTSPSTGNSQVQIISVSKAGSVPPVAADITTGASITTTGANAINANQNFYVEGVTFNVGTGANNLNFDIFPNSQQGVQYYKNCAINLVCTGASSRINMATVAGKVTWENTSVGFGAAGQVIRQAVGVDLIWMNTASPVPGATLPTSLFSPSSNNPFLLRCRGVDFNVLGSGKTILDLTNTPTLMRAIFEFCRFNASATKYTGLAVTGARAAEIDIIDCDTGATSHFNFYGRMGGDITIETTITRSGGAALPANGQKYSWKCISAAASLINFYTPFELPPIPKWNALTGVSRTAVIEFISSATLNNDDIWIELEYPGNASFPLSSFVNNTIATRLTANAAQTSSITTWDSSPATPQKQKLSVTFTPQLAGLVIARVKIAKASTTLYVDPMVTIT